MQIIDGPLDFRAIAAVAAGARLELSQAAQVRVATSRALVESIVKQKIRVYGVNTGVGALCDTLLGPAQLRELSHKILMSHASGVGPNLPPAQVRAVMASAINNFAHGRSGVRPVLVEYLLALLNADLIPLAPRAGSIGYITIMAHIAIVLVGEGNALSSNGPISGRAALASLGLKPLVLEAKEGLSLINGSPDTTGLSCVALDQMSNLLDWADVIAAMTFENIGHNVTAYSLEALRFSASESVRRSGERLTSILAGSEMVAKADLRTQDAMSLRAIPQVHGAVRDCFDGTVKAVDCELASVTDNPVVEGTVEQPVAYSAAYAIATGLALSLDALVIAVAKIAAMSERRIDRLVNPLVSGLSPFLAATPGVSTGFMIAQYTALAVVSENRRLAAPSSLDGGVSSALQEDEVPHSTTGALRLLQVISNFEVVLAIELLAAAQAYECRPSSTSRTATTEQVYVSLRRSVKSYADDRPISRDIDAARTFLRQRAYAVFDCLPASRTHSDDGN